MIDANDHRFFSGGWRYTSKEDQIIWSPSIYDILGLNFSPLDNGSKKIRDYFEMDAIEELNKFIAAQTEFDHIFSIRHPQTRDVISLRIIGTPFFINGEFEEFFGSYQSIDQQIVRQLESSNSIIESFSNNLTGLMISYVAKKPFGTVNLYEPSYKIFKNTDPNILRRLREYIHPDDTERVEASITRKLGNKEKYTVEYCLILPNQNELWVKESGHLVDPDTSDTVEALLLDITDLKNINQKLEGRLNDCNEQLLEQSETNERFISDIEDAQKEKKKLELKNNSLVQENQELKMHQEIQEKMTTLLEDYVYILDLHSKELVFTNRLAKQLIEKTEYNFQFHSYNSDAKAYIHPDDWVEFEKHHRKQSTVIDGKSISVSFRIRTNNDDEWMYLHCKETIFELDEDERPAKILGVATDVTHVKKCEARIEYFSKRLEETQKIAKIGSWKYNVIEDKIAFSGEAFEIFKLSETGKNPSTDEYLNGMHEEDQDLFLRMQNELIKTRKPYEIEIRYRTQDDLYMWGKLEATPIVENNWVTYVEGSIRDITLEKHLERKIKELEKIKVTIGRTLHHNFKSPLKQIKEYNSFNNTPLDDLKAANIVDKSCDLSLSTISDIELLLSTSDETIVMEKERTDLCLFLNDIAHQVQKKVEKKEIEIDIDLPYQKLISGINRGLLDIALRNLLESTADLTRSNSKIFIDMDVRRENISIFIKSNALILDKNELRKLKSELNNATLLRTSPPTRFKVSLIHHIIGKHNGTLDLNIKNGLYFHIAIPKFE